MRYRIRYERPADPEGHWTEASGYVLSNGRDIADFDLAEATKRAADLGATSYTGTVFTVEPMPSRVDDGSLGGHDPRE